MEVTPWSVRDRVPDQGILLIRHGPRGGNSLPPWDEPLTADGARLTTDLGSGWTGPEPSTLLTSPVPRCLQTSELLVAGAGWSIEPEPSSLLGDPGIFIHDMAGMEQIIEEARRSGRWHIFRDHVLGKDVPGMIHRDVGAPLLVEALDQRRDPEDLLLGVTHDGTIAALLCHKGYGLEEWPDYLCGALVHQ